MTRKEVAQIKWNLLKLRRMYDFASDFPKHSDSYWIGIDGQRWINEAIELIPRQPKEKKK